MSTFEVKIVKAPRGPQASTLVYYPSVMVVPSVGVSVDESIGYATQDATIAEIKRKLGVNVQANDTIRYDGVDYTTIDDAVTAITMDKPNWV